jgi:1-acyl-sn-glycerol-3-phosphate acyltransferase
LPNVPLIYIVNHKSNLDAVAMIKIIQGHDRLSKFCFVAKNEIKQSKLVSSALSLIDTIFIDRNNPRSVYEAYDRQIQAVNDNRSVVIFVEGHRFFNDEFGEFKSAAFKVAYQTYKPIVPIVIYGSSGLMDKNKENINKKRTIHIHALDILKHDDYATRKEVYLAQHLKMIMQDAYNQMKLLDTKNELITQEE